MDPQNPGSDPPFCEGPPGQADREHTRASTVVGELWATSAVPSLTPIRQSSMSMAIDRPAASRSTPGKQLVGPKARSFGQCLRRVRSFYSNAKSGGVLSAPPNGQDAPPTSTTSVVDAEAMPSSAPCNHFIEALQLLQRMEQNSQLLNQSIGCITTEVQRGATIGEARRRLQESSVLALRGEQSGSSGTHSFVGDFEPPNQLTFWEPEPSSGSPAEWAASGSGSKRSASSDSSEHSGGAPALGTRLRSMSLPEVGDAVERADTDARVRKWLRKHGHSELAHKLRELERKAHGLHERAVRHDQVARAEGTPSYERALSRAKCDALRRKHQSAVRLHARLEERSRR